MAEECLFFPRFKPFVIHSLGIRFNSRSMWQHVFFKISSKTHSGLFIIHSIKKNQNTSSCLSHPWSGSGGFSDVLSSSRVKTAFPPSSFSASPSRGQRGPRRTAPQPHTGSQGAPGGLQQVGAGGPLLVSGARFPMSRARTTGLERGSRR